MLADAGSIPAASTSLRPIANNAMGLRLGRPVIYVVKQLKHMGDDCHGVADRRCGASFYYALTYRHLSYTRCKINGLKEFQDEKLLLRLHSSITTKRKASLHRYNKRPER